MSSIVYKAAETDEELCQILELQRKNLQSAIPEEERLKEGFLTLHHDFKLLKAMNDACAHSLAKHNDKVVGYALSMTKEFKEDIDLLKPMFRMIEVNLPLGTSYIVMGQICIDKNFRKQGIFKGLYDFMKQRLQHQFDMIITEVDRKNTRSLSAHYAVGFKMVYSHRSNNQDWEIVSLNTNPN